MTNRVCEFEEWIGSKLSNSESSELNSESSEKQNKLQTILQNIVREETAYFWKVNFQEIELWDSNLQKAEFWVSKLQKARIYSSTFKEADLSHNNFQEAVFSGSQFQKANLSESDFGNARLVANNLQGANLSGSNLQKTILISNNFEEVKLSEINLDNVFLVDMYLQTAKELKESQFFGDKSALVCNTILPDHLGIDKDRDCDKLAQWLLENFPKKEDASGYTSIEEADKEIQAVREQAMKYWEKNETNIKWYSGEEE